MQNDNQSAGLTLRFDFPKVLVRRKIIYDSSDVEVGMAGALQLFLGISYIFIFEIMFYTLDKMFKLFAKVYKKIFRVNQVAPEIQLGRFRRFRYVQ